jgi:HSP20 family protein
MSTLSNGHDNPGANRFAQRRSVEPPVDVLESADNVLVIADIPGASPETVDVRVENDTLTLETRRPAGQPDASPALSREYDEVDFSRKFRIPAGIDASNISAEAKRGTLVVRLPKVSAAKPHKIDVRAS